MIDYDSLSPDELLQLVTSHKEFQLMLVLFRVLRDNNELLSSSAYDKDFFFVLPQCPDKPDLARHLPKLIGQCASAQQKIGDIILYEVPFIHVPCYSCNVITVHQRVGSGTFWSLPWVVRLYTIS